MFAYFWYIVYIIYTLCVLYAEFHGIQTLSGSGMMVLHCLRRGLNTQMI